MQKPRFEYGVFYYSWTRFDLIVTTEGTVYMEVN